jgi:hypothetical protein
MSDLTYRPLATGNESADGENDQERTEEAAEIEVDEPQY